ncbi:MAG: ComF family protein [Minisyncoccales bacterium]
MLSKIKNFLLDLLFPKFCLNCRQEGIYLCPDCEELLEITGFHRGQRVSFLTDLFFAVNYQNPLAKNLIQNFKYEPFIKELGQTISSLIIKHFQLMDNLPAFHPKINVNNLANFVLVPVPLHRSRLKWRGFNQAEEICKNLAPFFKLPVINNCLIRIKKTYPQIELTGLARKENINNAFFIKNKELIKNKNIILVDDVYTTGATMIECSRILKQSGAKKIIGLVFARD